MQANILKLTTETADKYRQERDRMIRQLVASGNSQASVARWFGISRERVRQIVSRQEE